MSKAFGIGSIGEWPSNPICAKPNEICSETFLEIGPFNSEIETQNVVKYLKTKFFRSLLSIRKKTQNSTSSVYLYIPVQNFSNNSDINWKTTIIDIDKQLYQKYNLTQEDIFYIDALIDSVE